MEIRFHGRGGQGTVIASKLFAAALFLEGKDVQSFPMFGVERRGAPVTAFVRESNAKIFPRHQIYQPDCVVVLDPSLIESVKVTLGLKSNGIILINTPKKADFFKELGSFEIFTVDATVIAVKHGLGTPTAPIVNTTILGALAGILKTPSMKAIAETIQEGKIPDPESNIEAAEDAYHSARGSLTS